MSSRQRKRPGGAVDSRPARKRSRLLPSSAGGTSQTEPTDLEERGTPAFEPDVIDLTGEDTIDLTGEDENAIDVAGEEVIQLRYEGVIHLPGESSEPEVITISDDESSMDREQSQQQLNLSRTSDEPLARGDEEEPRDIDDEDWLLFDFDPPYWSDEDSEDRQQNQQYPHVSSAAGNSADVLASNDEEEPRDVEGSALSRDWLLFDFDPPYWSDEDSELLEVHGQERRNVTSNSQEQVDGPGNGTGANDAPVADSAPEEQGAEEEDTQNPDSLSSSAQQGVVIRCPICMESYSEFIQRGRQLVATLCGHVFCSRCLPIALEASYMCPNCRMALTPELYHTIYL